MMDVFTSSFVSDVILHVKTVKIPDSPYTVELYVYDCAGQETFQPFINKVTTAQFRTLVQSMIYSHLGTWRYCSGVSGV